MTSNGFRFSRSRFLRVGWNRLVSPLFPGPRHRGGLTHRPRAGLAPILAWLAEGLLALVGAVNQPVRWQARIEGLAGRFFPCDRQGASIKQAELD